MFTLQGCALCFLYEHCYFYLCLCSHLLAQCHMVIHATVSANIFFYSQFLYLSSFNGSHNFLTLARAGHSWRWCSRLQYAFSVVLSSSTFDPPAHSPSPFRHFRDWLCFELRKRQPVWHSQLLRHLLRHAWLVTLLLFCFFYRSVKHGPLCSLVWLNYVQLCLLMW